jgi:hypothetical protein
MIRRRRPLACLLQELLVLLVIHLRIATRLIALTIHVTLLHPALHSERNQH